MSAVLETERLILRPVALEDFDDLCAVWADESVTRYITGQPMSAEDVWFRLLRDLGHWSALGHGNWSIRRREDEAFVGSVGVLDYRREMTPAFDAPELGWAAAPAHQGKGYMQEALHAALDWTRTELAAARTVCMIGPENTPSIRLAERIGYRPYAETLYKAHPVILFERRPDGAAETYGQS